MKNKEFYAFISYCRKDKDRVLPLVKDLEQQANVSCWIDLQGIESGSQFEDVIIKAINDAKIVLLMVSRHLNHNTYAKKEIDYALLKGKQVVPIILDDSDCPEWVLFKFSGYDSINLSDKDQYRKFLLDMKNWSGALDNSEEQSHGAVAKRIAKFWWYLPPAVVLLVLAIIWTMKNSGAEAVSSIDPLPASIEDISYTTVNIGGVSFCMIKVEGGTLEIESEDRIVDVNTFYIGETEVTQELWQSIMGNNPSSYTKENYLQHPVEQVSYEDCLAFLRTINRGRQEQFRLPTEAEWEFAAKGGNKGKSQENIYSGGSVLDDVAWYWQNSGDEFLPGDADNDYNHDLMEKNHCRSHVVKQKKPNELGLYDMSGNVLEWCADRFIDSGGQYDKDYIMRGGSWSCKAWECKVSARQHYTCNNRSSSLGLRLAMDVSEEE